MTVQMIVDRDSGRTFVLFAVTGVEDDFVSVVGSFNGWVPGVHILAPQSDGSRTAFVEVDHPGDIHFRYLASGSRWFDDPTAALVNEHGSTLLRREHAAPAVVADQPAATPLTSTPAKKTAKKTVAKKTPAKKAQPATKTPTKKEPVAKKTAAKRATKKSSSA